MYSKWSLASSERAISCESDTPSSTLGSIAPTAPSDLSSSGRCFEIRPNEIGKGGGPLKWSRARDHQARAGQRTGIEPGRTNDPRVSSADSPRRPSTLDGRRERCRDRRPLHVALEHLSRAGSYLLFGHFFEL